MDQFNLVLMHCNPGQGFDFFQKSMQQTPLIQLPFSGTQILIFSALRLCKTALADFINCN